jgi:hypothetical protein
MKSRLLGAVCACVFASAISIANASIVNPSFENDLTGWTPIYDTNFIEDTNSSFATEGVSNGRIFSIHLDPFSEGDKGGLRQTVDFTGIEFFTFDAQLLTFPGGSWDSTFGASAYIGSTLIWSSDVGGTYLDIITDTTGITGIQNLEFRLTSLSSQRVRSQWFLFDNLRISQVPVPAAVWLFGSGLLSLIGMARRKNAV